MLVMTTAILLLWTALNTFCNSCDKRSLCILLPHFRFLFRHLFSPFIPSSASSLFSSGFLWRHSSSLHFTACSSCFLGSFTWYCPCLCSGFFTGIVLLLLLFDFFLANLFSFPALITVPSSLHYLLDLAVVVAAADEKQASDILTLIWYPLCDGHDVYPTLAVEWSAYVFTLASWSKKKMKTNPRHCKSD